MFLQETAFSNFNFNKMSVADGSFAWRWLSTESAGDGEKRQWLIGLLITDMGEGQPKQATSC